MKNIYIELTNICDMACEYCPNPVFERPRKHMDFDLFVNIIDDIKANRLTECISLYAVGESLLYPRLLDAVAYCRKNGLKTILYTNGLRLTSDIYQKLVDSGIKNLSISFNDFSADTFAYRHARYKMTYDDFYQNLIDVINCHIKNNLPNNLLISFMLCKKEWISSELWDIPPMKIDANSALLLLQPFIKEMQKIAKQNKKSCHLNTRNLWFNMQALNIFQTKVIKIMDNVFFRLTALSPELFNTRKKLKEEVGKKIKLVKRTKGYCYFSDFTIFSDGSFTICSSDVLGELTVAKITNDLPLSSLIKCEKYKSFVRELKKEGTITNPVCQECKGTLVYRNPFRQIAYLIMSFNIYGYISNTLWKSEQFLRKVIWNKLTEQKKNRIRKIFKR